MKEIKLTRGKIALVDDSDFDRVNKLKWYAAKDHHYDRWYARRSKMINGQSIFVVMHRFILEVSDGTKHVDHINGEGLDNRRENLRLCSNSQNQGNQCDVRGASKFKGVALTSGGGKWLAQITINGKRTYLGSFDLEEDAAKTYDIAALEHFGKFAKTNKMLGLFKEEE